MTTFLNRLDENSWNCICDKMIDIKDSLNKNEKHMIYEILKKNKLLNKEILSFFEDDD